MWEEFTPPATNQLHLLVTSLSDGSTGSRAQQQRPNWPGERLADYPNDLTVKEAKELYERRRVEHAEWLDRKRSVERSFGAWLFELDYVPLHDADAVEVYLSWGHQHNEELNMSLSDTDCSPKENIADTPRIIDGKLIHDKSI